jgi:hypothetical protein
MRRFILAGFAVPFLAAAAIAAPAPEEPPVVRAAPDLKAEFEAVKAEFDKANQDFMAAYRAAKDDEGRNAALAKRPVPDDYLPRMLAVAAKDVKHPAAAECHAWIVQNVRKADAQAKSLEALLADHLEKPAIAKVCASLAYSNAANRDEFLKTVFEKSPDREAQGRACYALASLESRADRQGEAERLYELVVEKFGDLKYGNRTYAEKAKGDLFELRNLTVGKTAPEIVGEDENGKAMKLSDFRGKVVMLDFWGFW